LYNFKLCTKFHTGKAILENVAVELDATGTKQFEIIHLPCLVSELLVRVWCEDGMLSNSMTKQVNLPEEKIEMVFAGLTPVPLKQNVRVLLKLLFSNKF